MSTIRHPIQNHSWWYAAAAAVIVGLVALLSYSVVSAYLGPHSPSAPKQSYTIRHVPGPVQHACFARRPGSSVELDSRGCAMR